MKVGIVTLFGYGNYGNRLQNYAVQEILRAHDMEVITVRFFYKQEKITARNGIGRFLKRILPLKVSDRIKNSGIQYGLKAWKRYHKIGKWSRTYIPVQETMADHYEEISQNDRNFNYDYFVVGSDQVWNPDHIKPYFWLDFVPMEKRIGFIASIGVEEIDSSLQNDYKTGFQGMSSISVREQSAVDLIQEISGVYAECFFDPVLLVGKKCWEKFMKAPSGGISKRYLLCFFLGEVDIKKIRGTYGKEIEVVYVAEPYKKQDGCYGIEEFIYLFAHADFVFTDSFHGTVLSILFHKSFFVFNRREKNKKNMMTRLESMLGELGLSNRISDFESLAWDNDRLARISDRDYEYTDQIIENKKIAFEKWMQEVFV